MKETLKDLFIPSDYFCRITNEVIKTMLFQSDDRRMGIFCWFILPVILGMLIGWYISDRTLCRLTVERANK